MTPPDFFVMLFGLSNMFIIYKYTRLCWNLTRNGRNDPFTMQLGFIALLLLPFVVWGWYFIAIVLPVLARML